MNKISRAAAALLILSVAAPRAFAQRDERGERGERGEREEREVRPQPQVQVQPKPVPIRRSKAEPKRQGPKREAPRREEPRREKSARPAPTAKPRPAPVVPAPAPKPKIARPAAPRTPQQAETAARPRSWYRPPEDSRPRRDLPLPKPAPITNPKHFVRDGVPPSAPPPPSPGGAPAPAPSSQAPIRHGAIVGNPAVTTTIISQGQNETVENRYYWHDGGGYRWVHCYRDRQHWYGFWAGSDFYWARWHYGRWWWYDPFYHRYSYWYNGWWWWQDPFVPQMVYVYQNNTYVPYEEAVEQNQAASSAAAAPVAAAAAPVAAAAAPVAAPAPKPAFHSDADSPDYAAPEDPNRYALVIGVSNYGALPAQPYAEHDAQAVRAHLRALGFPDANVETLTSTEAVRSTLGKFVEGWLPDRATAESRVFVYFSGRGATDPKTGTEYLLPWDGDPKYLSLTGYAVKDLYAQLNALPAKEIVVAIDAGFSGAGSRSVPISGGSARPDPARASVGRAVALTAAAPDESAGDDPSQSHGLFTYWLLKGLNSGGATAGDDGVTVQSLYDFSRAQVEDEARRAGRDQTPQMLVPPDGQRRMLFKDLR